MPPISLGSLIAQATRGGRSVVSRRNFCSSRSSNEPKVAEIIGWLVFGSISAAAGYGTAYHLFEVDEMELVKERQKVETNKQEALE
ncbi:hypothetical protein ISN44_As08g012660 [Arabidopsis suecica]|uniref:Uncharacterized protein n=1 Tax=Arabidopsis suecica TaxID=45249 RepID=A0A8T1XIA1_ARASU|nr:hypothetical protein ISN44_Un60g000010 [Arabidopsis suecica]KAG7580945.1 hypothetical protein ISN44_As08g006910 [Arabidopsis suecica]KAG7581603.1 hypothetical protein ISN44_As08g012660 [Arabidopsis suecica]